MDHIQQPYSASFLPSTADGWALILTSITITILFIIAAYLGGQKPFYQELLKKFPQNTWLIAGLWVGASVISYFGFFFLRDKDPNIYPVGTLWPFYVLINYLNLLWIVIFYIYESFTAALSIIFIIILIYLYLIIMLFGVSVWAALLLFPLEGLYIYLFYSLLHLASVNGVVI